MKNIFKIKKEERVLAIASMLVFATFNMLLLHSYPNIFFKAGKLGFWSIFYKHFTVSGFDAYSYIFLSNEKIYYELSRHPLFSVLLYPGYWLNQALMDLTSNNCATYIMAVMLVISATFSAIFFFRICRELISLSRLDSHILTAFFFSFASILLTTIVPDHFCFSMLCLLASIYIIGSNLKRQRKLKAWQTCMLFLCTAGISLSNGVKTGLMALFNNGKQVFAPRFLAIALLFPLVAMGGLYYYQDKYIIKPQQERGKQIEQKQRIKHPEMFKANAIHDDWMKKSKGKAIADKPFLKWTDIQTSRIETIVENLFGEGIQLHQEYLLKDHSVSRPTFVKYSWPISYLFEGIVILLFAIGIYYSRHTRWMNMVFCCVAFDIFLHLVLGFGINEVYIMGAHWMFVIPFAIGHILVYGKKRLIAATRWTTLALTLYFWAYNGSLIAIHFLENDLNT